MNNKTGRNYLSNRSWLSDNIADQEVILRGVSALEYLEMFDGYTNESDIFVYSKDLINLPSLIVTVVDSFDEIEYIRFGDVLCSTFDQAINDMLEDEDLDELALSSALGNYYYTHNNSYDGLNIKDSNTDAFEHYKSWGIGYYSGG